MPEPADSTPTGPQQAEPATSPGDLHDRYYNGVYDFTVRLTRDEATASRLTEQAFRESVQSLGGPQGEAGFKTRLFAVAMRNARRQPTPPAMPSRPPADEFARVDGEHAVAAAMAAGATPALVWEAASRLDQQHYAVLDLHRRQRLDMEQVARVLGVTRASAEITVSRVEAAAEAAIGASLLAGSPGTCPAMAELAPAGDASAIEGHSATCPECQGRLELLSPLAVFAALDPVAPPQAAKGRSAAAFATLLPLAAAGGSGVPPLEPGAHAPAGPSGPDGWSTGRAVRTFSTLGVVAAVLAVALIAPFSPISLTRGGGDDNGAAFVPVAPDSTATPQPTTGPGTPTRTTSAATATPRSTATASATPQPGETPGTATATAPPGSTATNTPSATSTGTVTATPTRTPTTPPMTPTPCLPSLSPNVTAINIVHPQNSRTFLLTSGSCVSTSFDVASNQPWLSASSSVQVVPGFGQAIVNLLVDTLNLPGLEGSFAASVGIDVIGGQDASVSVLVVRGGNAPTIGTACYSASETLTTVGALTVQDDYSGVASVTAVVHHDDSGEQVVALTKAPSINNWHVQLAGPGWTAVSVTATDNAGLARTVPAGPC